MSSAVRTASLSILSNALLIVLKLVVGILSGAVSIISEAIHSFMDLAASVMAFFSIRLARRPADMDHPYGHEKVENVSGVVEAILILLAAVLIIYESIKKLVAGEVVDHLELGIAVMVVSGVVNIVVSRRLYRVAEEEKSVALEADALHLRTDVYSSLGVAAGLLVIVVLKRAFGVPWAYYLDPVVAMGIAVLILREAWKMLRKAFAPLLDASIAPDELAAIQACVDRHPHVSLHAIRTRSAGGKKYIDFHLFVAASMSVKDAHHLCDVIERDLEKALSHTSVIIHVEPAPGRMKR